MTGRTIHGFSDHQLTQMSEGQLYELNLQADLDFARRSLPGAVIILLAVLVAATFTDIRTDSPVLFHAIVILLLGSVISRLFILKGLKRQTPESIRRWEWGFSLAVMTTAICWGAFVAVALHQYGVTTQTVIVLLMTTGVAGGAAIALFIWRNLAQLYLMVLLLFPVPMVWWATGGDLGLAFGLAFSLVIYFLFLYFQVQRSHGEYWRALLNTKLLESQTQELLQAKSLAEQASSAKSNFLANMSHELRTPLNAILGFAQLMEEDTGLTPSNRRNMREISLAGEHLLSLINEILDLSRIETGQLQVENRPFDLYDALDELLTVTAPQAYEKGLGLELNIDPALARQVKGDRLRLKQVLGNLLDNAIKFTNDGGVALNITAAGDGLYQFEVVDSGIGIKADLLPTLFEPFTQGDVSATRRYGGAGMGLAICQQMVRAMGGDIGVESTPAKGARFWLTLPLEAAGRDAPPPQVAGWRVLYLGGRRGQSTALERYLQYWGASVEHLWEESVALELLTPPQGHDYRLVVLDETLPGGTSYDAMRERLNETPWPKGLQLSRPWGKRFEVCGLLNGLSLQEPIRPGQMIAALTKLTAQPEAIEVAPARRPPQEENLSSGREMGRVLLVEDDRVNQMVAKKMLNKLGYNVTTANDGQDALERAAEGAFAAILMDIQMPVMDGYDATRALLARDQGAPGQPPIIAMTANAMSGDRERCLAAGMVDYIAKPIRYAELEKKMRQWVRG